MRIYWSIVAIVVIVVALLGLRQPSPHRPTATAHAGLTNAPPPISPAAQRKRDLSHWRGLAFGLGPLDERTNAMAQLVRMEDVDSVEPLIKLLEPPPRGAKYRPPQELRPAVIETLAAFGPSALPKLNELVIEGECDSREMEQGAAEVLKRIGRPAAPILVANIMRWKLYPDPQELRLWVGVLKAIGDPSAAPALARAAEQEPQPPVPMPQILPRPAFGPLTPRDPQGRTIPTNGVVQVVLENALVRPFSAKAQQPQPLEIELVRRDGNWQTEGHAYSLNYNKREHEVRVVSANPSDTALRLQVAVLDDTWVRGGFAEFKVDLTAGRYDGHYNYSPRAGAMSMVTWDQQWPSTPPDRVAQDEHPRLLFRPRDLPSLRAKARTEFGQRVLQILRARLAASKTMYREPVHAVKNWEPGMNLAIGHAFLSVLFDDPEHGRRAAELIIARSRTMPYWGEHGERLPGPVFHFPFGYDLAWPGLTAEEREEAGLAMESFCGLMPQRRGLNDVFAAGHPPHMYGIPGLMALARWREAAPYFDLQEPEPVTPFLEIVPPSDAGDAPENEFVAGSLIRNWNVTTTPRTTQVFGNQFEVLALAVEPALLKCRLRVKEPTGCKLDPRFPLGQRWTKLWINGQEIREASIVQFQPGVHEVRLLGNGQFVSPIFDPADAGEAHARAERYAMLRESWERARAQYAQDGESAKFAFFVDACATGMRLWLKKQQQNHVYGGGDLQWPFVTALRNVTGAGCYPDTPMPAALDPQRVGPQLSKRALCFQVGVVPELAPAFDSGVSLDGLSCLELVAAFVNYPAK
jgi:hypothetical protein